MEPPAPKRKAFQLGEQPVWAGEEPAVDPGASFVAELLSQPPEAVLNARGYCLVTLDAETEACYSDFHADWLAFCADENEKIKAAQLQFEQATHSPNQYHGYSQVQHLKEQFMMRDQGGSLAPLLTDRCAWSVAGWSCFAASTACVVCCAKRQWRDSTSR
jgi:hypothetical protein